MAAAKYPQNDSTFTGGPQSPPSSTAPTPGHIGANPNSTGGTEMKPIRDYRPERMSGATRFGDQPVKDMYDTGPAGPMCVNPSDPFLNATYSDRS